MNEQAVSISGPDWHKIQQVVKWVVYTILIVNFAFYVIEDARRAVYTLHAGSTFLDWTSAFATSIDESAWFLLLAMFEIETYVIDDEKIIGWVAYTLHGIRLLCVVLLTHTVYAFLIIIIDLQPTVPVDEVSSLCDMTDANVSYVYNLEYAGISDQNCSQLSAASQFYWVAKDPVVSDMAGLTLERNLAWADLAEVVLWVLIILAIEIVVRLQGHGITGGKLITTANAAKIFFYASLFVIGIYWVTVSHWFYFWDELVWILGFAAIEMNLSDWREEIVDSQATN